MPLNGVDLDGARVLLCGATGGLGRALLAELSTRGAIVTATGRDPGILADLQDCARVVAADLRNSSECAEVVRRASEDGSLDVTINAAGVVAFGPITEMTPAACVELLEVNTLIPMLIAREALPRTARGGVMANISAVVAEGPAPLHMAAYTASKAGASALAHALARDARRQGIRVLDIRPPHTETGLAERAICGEPPAMKPGLSADNVARVICDALTSGATDLSSDAFRTAGAAEPVEQNQ